MQLLTIAASVATPIGALCFIAGLIYQLRDRQEKARNLTGIIGHQHDSSGPQILKVLTRFKTDEARLKALEILLNGQAKQAEEILKKVKGDINVERMFNKKEETIAKSLKYTGTTFFLIGLLAVGLPLTPSFDHMASSPFDLQPVNGHARTNVPVELDSDLTDKRLQKMNRIVDGGAGINMDLAEEVWVRDPVSVYVGTLRCPNVLPNEEFEFRIYENTPPNGFRIAGFGRIEWCGKSALLKMTQKNRYYVTAHFKAPGGTWTQVPVGDLDHKGRVFLMTLDNRRIAELHIQETKLTRIEQ